MIPGITASELCVPSVTGGTVTFDSTYIYHTFTTSGNFTVSSGKLNVEVFMVGGGGGGGPAKSVLLVNRSYPPQYGAFSCQSGGGGAAGNIASTFGIVNHASSVVSGATPVVVGSGGSAGSYGYVEGVGFQTFDGAEGGASSFNGVYASGGLGGFSAAINGKGAMGSLNDSYSGGQGGVVVFVSANYYIGGAGGGAGSSSNGAAASDSYLGVGGNLTTTSWGLSYGKGGDGGGNHSGRSQPTQPNSAYGSGGHGGSALYVPNADSTVRGTTTEWPATSGRSGVVVVRYTRNQVRSNP